MWRTFKSGSTIGQPGSESGVIVRDEEHDDGARITLERNCQSAPWTVTCGIYGWFFHTRFVSSESDAEFTQMTAALTEVLETIPRVDDLDSDRKVQATTEAIERFVSRFA